MTFRVWISEDKFPRGDRKRVCFQILLGEDRLKGPKADWGSHCHETWRTSAVWGGTKEDTFTLHHTNFGSNQGGIRGGRIISQNPGNGACFPLLRGGERSSPKRGGVSREFTDWAAGNSQKGVVPLLKGQGSKTTVTLNATPCREVTTMGKRTTPR